MAQNRPATKTLVTRRLNATLEATGQEISNEERELIVANVLSFANDPKFIIANGTPAERITSENLADAALRLHFSQDPPIDLTAKELDAAECYAAAKELLASERQHETKLKKQAQESRRPFQWGNIRVVNTRDMDLPKGFSID